MNNAEWLAQRAARRKRLNSFCHRYRVELAEVEAARAMLAKHAKLIRLLEQIEQRANASAPIGYVRCQAVHHGLFICDDIAPRHALPKGWVVSVVGDLCFCPVHTEHAQLVNAPTLAANGVIPPLAVEDIVMRR